MKIKLSKLDNLFSQYIRLRANGICEYCGQTNKRLETSHFISRRYRATRWKEENVCAVCFTCHRYLDEHPYLHTEFWKKRIGTDGIEKLHIMAETMGKKVDIDQLTEHYKEKVRLVAIASALS